MDISGGSYEALIELPSITSLSVLLAVAYSIFCACICLHRLFLSPIAAIPGPKLAAASQWYETYYEIFYDGGGQFTKQIWKLHAQYG